MVAAVSDTGSSGLFSQISSVLLFELLLTGIGFVDGL
jgi:hypothetical protein